MSNSTTLSPVTERKPDSSHNPSGVDDKLFELRKRDLAKVPFRIDKTTVVLVSPDKRTEQYRQKYITKYRKY